LILAVTTACTSQPAPPVEDSAPTPAAPVAEKEGNFTLYVSNQSFDRETVDISVAIDGKKVVSQLFEVKNQHNWIDFIVQLAAGEHKLQVFSTAGSTQLTKAFTTTARHWAVVNYWCCGEPDDPKFTFDLSDQPIGFA